MGHIRLSNQTIIRLRKVGGLIQSETGINPSDDEILTALLDAFGEIKVTKGPPKQPQLHKDRS